MDIFGSKATTIPRIQGDKGVRLTCQDPQGQPLTAQEVYAKVNPSVVTVVSEQADGASIGTGVIMTSDGYIITNAHVISGGKSCWVALDTGVTYDVKLVGYDEENYWFNDPWHDHGVCPQPKQLVEDCHAAQGLFAVTLRPKGEA